MASVKKPMLPQRLLFLLKLVPGHRVLAAAQGNVLLDNGEPTMFVLICWQGLAAGGLF